MSIDFLDFDRCEQGMIKTGSEIMNPDPDTIDKIRKSMKKQGLMQKTDDELFAEAEARFNSCGS